MKLLTILGARPQFIKASPLSRILKTSSVIQEKILHTGQHFDANMSDIFFEELEIPTPTYHLNIQGGAHGQMTGRMLESIEEILQAEAFDAVLVYGDTNSTLAGALAAAKLGIPVVHIEAGLRSYNKTMPEETNRVLTDHLSTLLFCPTTQAIQNLKKENITEGVSHTGDLMFDATLFALEKVKKTPVLFERFPFSTEPFALLTLHRQDTTASPEAFHKRLDYARTFAKEKNLKLVFPVHPRSRPYVEDVSDSHLMTLDPLSYFEMHALLSKASYVLTDSGGLQKEAYFHQTPCITLRSETEWVETLEAGWNRLWTEEAFQVPRQKIDAYGNGRAALVMQEKLYPISMKEPILR